MPDYEYTSDDGKCVSYQWPMTRSSRDVTVGFCPSQGLFAEHFKSLYDLNRTVWGVLEDDRLSFDDQFATPRPCDLKEGEYYISGCEMDPEGKILSFILLNDKFEVRIVEAEKLKTEKTVIIPGKTSSNIVHYEGNDQPRLLMFDPIKYSIPNAINISCPSTGQVMSFDLNSWKMGACLVDKEGAKKLGTYSEEVLRSFLDMEYKTTTTTGTTTTGTTTTGTTNGQFLPLLSSNGTSSDVMIARNVAIGMGATTGVALLAFCYCCIKKMRAQRAIALDPVGRGVGDSASASSGLREVGDSASASSSGLREVVAEGDLSVLPPVVVIGRPASAAWPSAEPSAGSSVVTPLSVIAVGRSVPLAEQVTGR